MIGYVICNWDSILDKGRDSPLPHRVQTSTGAQSACKATDACFIAKRQNTKSSWVLSYPITTRLQFSSSPGTYRNSGGLSVSMLGKLIMSVVLVQWTALCFLDLTSSLVKEGSPAIFKQAKEFGFRTGVWTKYSCDTANKLGEKHSVLNFFLLVNLLWPLQ